MSPSNGAEALRRFIKPAAKRSTNRKEPLTPNNGGSSSFSDTKTDRFFPIAIGQE